MGLAEPAGNVFFRMFLVGCGEYFFCLSEFNEFSEVEKSSEVTGAITKAVSQAKKHMVTIVLRKNTIPHEVFAKKSGARVFLKPASEGTGVIAGGAVRAVLEAAGVKDILSKMLGSNSKINNAYATIEALQSLREKKVKMPEVKEKKTESTKSSKKTTKDKV